MAKISRGWNIWRYFNAVVKFLFRMVSIPARFFISMMALHYAMNVVPLGDHEGLKVWFVIIFLWGISPIYYELSGLINSIMWRSYPYEE